MTALATDNFNRANSSGLGTNWTQTENVGVNRLDVSSNAATNANDGGSDASDFYNAVTWPNDQYSQADVTLNANPGDQDGPAVAVRMASAAVTYYRVVWTLGQTHLSIAKKVTGTYTLLTQPASGTLTNGDLLRAEAQGTTIRGALNGSVSGSTTDSSISTGNAGLSYSSDGTGKVATWDNWEGGDFGGGVVVGITLMRTLRGVGV